MAILKILKTKSTTLSDNLFLCQVSKGSAVWSEFNICCTLVTMATAAIFEFFQPLKSCHTLRWIFLQSFMKFDERNPKLFFSWQLRQSLSNRFRFFFSLSRSTRCGCCSYQVSSISVWLVTCYDHFCVFLHFGRFHGNGSHFEKINP